MESPENSDGYESLLTKESEANISLCAESFIATSQNPKVEYEEIIRKTAAQVYNYVLRVNKRLGISCDVEFAPEEWESEHRVDCEGAGEFNVSNPFYLLAVKAVELGWSCDDYISEALKISLKIFASVSQQLKEEDSSSNSPAYEKSKNTPFFSNKILGRGNTISGLVEVPNEPVDKEVLGSVIQLMSNSIGVSTGIEKDGLTNEDIKERKARYYRILTHKGNQSQN